ncbi:MAG: hypothetical protein JSS27_06595 [Planctomycetes bacterium]|nr:hypothetical protein [Planctomycetota bacterium]
MVPKKPAKKSPKRAALLGLGLDKNDDITRLTRGENFVLCGGTAETHSQMQETVIKVNEKLDQRGKRLEDVSPRELADIFHDVTK